MAPYKKKNEKFFDGYCYFIVKKTRFRTNVRCALYRSHDCPGEGYFKDFQFHLTEEHTHARNPRFLLKKQFCAELRTACMTQMADVKPIYDFVSIFHKEAAVLLPFSKIRNSMYSWKRQMYLPIPPSFRMFRAIIQQNKYCNLVRHDEGSMDIKFNVNRHGINSVNFIDFVLINKILFNCQESPSLFIFSGEELLPSEPNTCRLVTWIISYKNNYFPISWNLLTNNNFQTYDQITTNIHQILTLYKINLAGIYHNFDQAIYSSIKTKFSSTSTHGCFTAHCKIILHYASTIQQIDLENQDHYILILKFICISLLPSYKMINTFKELCAAIPPDMIGINGFRDFMAYYNKYWINFIGVEHYSYYKKIHAIRDVCDSFENKCRKIIRKTNKTIWIFVKMFLEWYEHSHKDVYKIGTHKKLNDSTFLLKNKSLWIDEDDLKKLWDYLDEEKINTHHFLAVAVDIIRNMINNYIHNDLPSDVNFELMKLNSNETDVVLPTFQHVSNDLIFKILLPGQVNDLIQKKKKKPSICVTCDSNVAKIKFLPCCHIVYCRSCCALAEASSADENDDFRCPLCRRVITETILRR